MKMVRALIVVLVAAVVVSVPIDEHRSKRQISQQLPSSQLSDQQSRLRPQAQLPQQQQQLSQQPGALGRSANPPLQQQQQPGLASGQINPQQQRRVRRDVDDLTPSEQRFVRYGPGIGFGYGGGFGPRIGYGAGFGVYGGGLGPYGGGFGPYGGRIYRLGSDSPEDYFFA